MANPHPPFSTPILPVFSLLLSLIYILIVLCSLCCRYGG